MPHCRVVQGEAVVLPLSDGDSITVKSELNAGEYFDLMAALAERQSFAGILAYVLAWTFVGLDGKPLPWDPDSPAEVRRATVRSLDKATVRELVDRLNRHELATDAAHEAKKKDEVRTRRIESNLRICRAMNGWKYAWVDELPRDVYETLVTMLNRKAED